MDKLRKQIDEIDSQIIKLLEMRFLITAQVGEYKKEHHLPIYDQKREQLILKKISDKINNDLQYILPIYQEILKESKKQQGDVINESNNSKS